MIASEVYRDGDLLFYHADKFLGEWYDRLTFSQPRHVDFEDRVVLLVDCHTYTMTKILVGKRLLFVERWQLDAYFKKVETENPLDDSMSKPV